MNEYKFEVRIGSRDINCRAFTLREYKDLLTAKVNHRLEDEIKTLIKKCTDAPEMSRQESELLLVKLWASSLGEVNHEHTYVCECGLEQQVPLNFMHASFEDPEDLLYPLGPFKIKFKYPKLFEDKNKAIMVANCIEYIITHTGEQLSVDDLTEAEIDELYSAITVDDIEKISEMLLRPQIQMAVPISCSCGKSSVHIIKGLKDFFKLI